MIKRAIDVALSLLALVLLSPVLAVVALVVRFSMGRPVLFRQIRPGLDARPFTLLKFRTMRSAVDRAGRPLPDEHRITRVGRLLRSTSLDELPELWNVLRGDMSIVGPRPLLMQYLPLYSQVQARRHAVKPGLTGLAQVNGRNELPWDERFELDSWYVDHHNLWLDLRIIMKTVAVVLSRRGISQEGHATAPAFTGSADRQNRGES